MLRGAAWCFVMLRVILYERDGPALMGFVLQRVGGVGEDHGQNDDAHIVPRAECCVILARCGCTANAVRHCHGIVQCCPGAV